ncbi:DUF3717 domain-containing protein [Variovorax sp. PCZ-1]|uniref:DUF3717 domain-containing protein n=1 Tax=Variovorax sp. PCZ-1 TaxID=2835533 RepID=UPI001BCF8DE1|nr:DUF3717 domain-containing protein [Variovorax sp. PCZ-1]MBS7806039.1 DUF3717 domain-containing protein [Variovorax sp. PCZ-1]
MSDALHDPFRTEPVGIHISDIEAAINYWRIKSPSPDGVTLAAPLRALAEIYALMVFHKQDRASEFSMPKKAMDAWLAWYESTPDTPCIAICSTSQGDDFCKGCGRKFAEVQYWPEMSPAAKRAVWQRITQEGTSWRFNRYAERAAETREQAAIASTPLLL